ncbi:MAG: hypothetical protein U0M06_05620 [Clostridia bacterium]|nr:hypothetical protein [Clostridia bacterium]
MTTQMSCSDRKNYDLNFNKKYFLGELKRSWPKMVLYFVIFLLTMILPLLMSNFDYSYSSVSTYLSPEEILLRTSKDVLETIKDFAYVWAPISMLVALFAGCYVTKILNNRVSADFYHSTPLRRENFFITRTLVGVSTYLITFILSVVTVIIICESYTLAEGFGKLIFKQIIVNFGYSLLSFFVVFSITVFAGMLCGTTIMQLIMTLYLNLVVFVYYVSLFLTLDKFTYTFNATWYLERDITFELIPFVRFMKPDFTNDITAVDICFFIIGAFLLLVGALALYKFRKIEKAGTPIVFNGFATFFRYSVIIPSTLLGGLFFRAIGSVEIWYFFGLVLGSILCFMLLNTILEKNARKMFKGIKTFALYSVVMAIVILAFLFDIFGINNYIPSAKNVKSVNITISNEIQEINFEDNDVIKSIISLDKWASGDPDFDGDVYSVNYVYSTVYGEIVEITKTDGYEDVVEFTAGKTEKDIFSTDVGNKTYVRIVYTPRYGIPVAREIIVPIRCEEMTDLAKAIADSDDYRGHFKDIVSNIQPGNSCDRSYDAISTNNFTGNYTELNLQEVDKIRGIAEKINYEYFQRTQIGRFRIYGYDRYPVSIPVFSDDDLSYGFRRNLTIDEYYDSISLLIDSIVICNANVSTFSAYDEGVLIIKDREQIIEILKNASSLATGNDSFFTETEPGYQIGISYNAVQVDQIYKTNYTTHFLKDSVPAFVLNFFKVK